MNNSLSDDKVSVIVTCYNQGKFLAKALQSVIEQNYTNIQLILVDDGSTDDTRLVAADFPQAYYHYQNNRGLAAARNTGLRFADGNSVCFLDADDWFVPNAISTNAAQLHQYDDAAFVAGAHKMFFADTGQEIDVVKPVSLSIYHELLRNGNFIGMHACVLYRRWVFNSFQFNTALKYCEDYDLYLRITRKFPAYYHQQFIAVYHQHHSNMSRDYGGMLYYVHKLLSREYHRSESEAEKKFTVEGKAFYTDYYIKKLSDDVFNNNNIANNKDRDEKLNVIRKYHYPSYRWLVQEMNLPMLPPIKKPLLQRVLRKIIPAKK